ncbi:MAG: hypothetical protein K2X29_05445 [Candidatus Obscuribacterales bacterium]|nr:hypothetical protein [Candidatus Obscuribacterales bacterium]
MKMEIEVQDYFASYIRQVIDEYSSFCSGHVIANFERWVGDIEFDKYDGIPLADLKTEVDLTLHDIENELGMVHMESYNRTKMLLFEWPESTLALQRLDKKIHESTIINQD